MGVFNAFQQPVTIIAIHLAAKSFDINRFFQYIILKILNYAFLKARLIPFFTCFIDEIEMLFLSKPFKERIGWKTNVTLIQLIFKKLYK
tara:strand:+ start:12286 stop:12552 length:267 start_codon:yes stop_codon:yes gene_type:complete